MTTINREINLKELTSEQIRVRLYNEAKANKCPIWRSAEEYGFEDLILVPVVELDKDDEDGIITAKITGDILEATGWTEDYVIAKGIENTKATITPLIQMIADMMGVPVEEMQANGMDNGVVVITNDTMICGAGAVIGARETLREMFPNGYVVLPSSIHEALVVPSTGDEGETEMLVDMVRCVNEGCVDEEDKLADNAYVFAA